MGVLENSHITLENGDKINIEDLKVNDKVLSCIIDGLNNKTINKEAIIWSEVNPKIEKADSKVTNKWKESVDRFMIINNKLKITLDNLILLKNFEGETTWGYSKSLRKGYFLFNDKFEYEEIKTIKRVKENVSSICLSVSMCSYYFVNGYLVHNTSLCDACDTCHYWPAILQHYGPHEYDSQADPVSTTYGHGNNQNQMYTKIKKLNSYYSTDGGSSWSLGSASGNHMVPWNYFPRFISLYNPYTQSNRPDEAIYYYVFKWWDKTKDVPTSTNGNLEPGWRSYVGTDSTAGSKVRSIMNDDLYNCPHDFWYYSDFVASNGSEYNALQLIYTGTAGAKWCGGFKSDSSIDWFEYDTVLSNARPGVSDTLTFNEDTHGGRGNSKIYIYIKIPVSPNNAQWTRYDLRWKFNNNDSFIDPNGWFSLTSWRPGETI